MSRRDYLVSRRQSLDAIYTASMEMWEWPDATRQKLQGLLVDELIEIECELVMSSPEEEPDAVNWQAEGF